MNFSNVIFLKFFQNLNQMQLDWIILFRLQINSISGPSEHTMLVLALKWVIVAERWVAISDTIQTLCYSVSPLQWIIFWSFSKRKINKSE